MNRTLLIVEDDPALNNNYKMFCEIALRELSQEGLPKASTADVQQAFDLAQARAVLESHAVDFVSIDIALDSVEERLTQERRKTTEPGGMVLLKELKEYKRRPVSVVVTGEGLMSYAIDALGKYGAMNVYQKDTFNAKQYMSAVKAALWYKAAADLVTQAEKVFLETERELDAADEHLNHALVEAEVAGVQVEGHFLEALRYEIDSVRNKLTHSVTGLPTGRWTQEVLKRRVVGQTDWALICATIKGFNEFVTNFASQEESVLTFTAGLFKRSREEFNDDLLFAGHLGYRKDTSEPRFVILPSTKRGRRVKDIADWIKDEFERKAGLFVPSFGGQAEQPDLTIETKIWTGDKGKTFSDTHDLLDTLGSA